MLNFDFRDIVAGKQLFYPLRRGLCATFANLRIILIVRFENE